ncbi:MAG: TonB-dependent receptor [Prolixibacteraceae bacterium]|jgi:outer membrane receptor protein involved in Fe transport|nr:TonB-dependent receptor [Prolixibacteraceae bacterium]
MSGKRKRCLLLVYLILPLVAMAQNHFRISGKVTDSLNGAKIEMVTIQIKELNSWTMSNAEGDFNLEKIPKGTYTLVASCLGFQTYEASLTVNGDIAGYKLMLSQISLGLKEVVVVARERTALSTSSKIESTALEHVQPTSLADVLQLVPGQITLNPDMSKTNQIALREINTANRAGRINPDDNSAMGTAIIVDGTPVNNDGNMQTVNTVTEGTSQVFSTAGQGVDLRQIATDNIESVEVIRGIPSAEYGELTTGAVLVRTKAGKTRLNVKIKADPNIKQAAISKGFLLPGENKGAVNMDVDYSHAFNDLREPTKSYNRLTGQLGYANTFFKDSNPLSVNAKFSYYRTFDNEKNDPDMLQRETYQEKEQSFGVKFFGTWSVKRPWLTNLTYNFSGDFEEQDYYEYKVTSRSGATPLPIATVSGESVGTVLPSSYDSELKIEGKPYNYFATIKGNVSGKYGNLYSNLMYGLEWRTTGNSGAGRIYEVTRPPVTATTTRPRSFNDVPANKNLALFLEEKLNFSIGPTRLKTEAGLRYNNMLPRGLFTTSGFKSLEPRLNLTYDLFQQNNDRMIRDLSLRFGYGQTSKTPSMICLYPDKAYHDEIGFNYYPDLLVITTKVIDGVTNPDLKPITATKYEAGVDFDLLGVKVLLTGFKEKIENGFTWENQYYVMDFKLWNPLAGANKSPSYSNGEIWYKENGETLRLPYTNAKEYGNYNVPKNSYDIDKQGIEYVVNFGEVESLRSSFSVDGAYYNIKKISRVLPYSTLIGSSYQGQRYPYLPVYPGGDGERLQRLNSNLRIITHIPDLKMVTSIGIQVVWFDKAKGYWADDRGNAVYFSKGVNNQKNYGVTDGVDKVYVDPIGYYDKAMAYHSWQDNLTYDSPYSFMVKEYKSNQYNVVGYPIAFQINLKLTKEMGRGARLSFFANNIFNNRPLFFNPNSGQYVRRNESAYFGAEIKFVL